MRFIKFLILPLITILISSCATEHSKIIVAEYGDNKIYMNEFEKAYAKNSGGIEKAKSDSIDAYKKFLDLYVNYRMKLRDGEVRGFSKDNDMKKEFIDYKTNIGSAIFLEKELYEPNLKTLYERRKVEYRASHIFLTVDSANTKEKVIEFGKKLIDSINHGADFAKFAAKYSKDSYSSNKGGDVYYFTAGRINSAAIEDAIYSLEKGQVYPEPVYSGFGYHILKITDKQTRIPMIRVSHILIRSEDSTGVVDTLRALNKIKDIEKQLKQGADFGELAMKYSEDPGSKKNRGDLSFFERGRMVPQFDEAAFKLKVGEVSPIVKTQFGYHLIKVTDVKPLKPYEEEKEELRELFKRVRYKAEYDKIVEKLKKEFNFKLNSDMIPKLVGEADTLKVTQGYSQSNLIKKYGNQTLFSFANKNIPVDSLFMFMVKSPIYLGNKFDYSLLDKALNQYEGDILVKEKALNYDKIDSEFATLMDEYKNGMSLFKLLEDEVWTKIKIDSASTVNFWEKNKGKFQWQDRVEFKEIYVNSDSLMKKVADQLKSGVNFDSLYTKFNKRTGYENKPGYYGLVNIDVNELAIKANAIQNTGQISTPFRFEDGWSIVKLIRKDNARLKTFDEAKPEVIGMFQEFESKRLEDEYINRLKNLYKPKMFYDELPKAYKE